MEAAQLAPLYTEIIQGVALLIVAGIGYMTTKTQMATRRKVDNDEIEKALLTTLDVTDSSLRSIILGLGENLKKKLADGKLSTEEIREIKCDTLTKVEKEVAPALLERAEAHVGDLATHLLTRIEGGIQKADRVTR